VYNPRTIGKIKGRSPARNITFQRNFFIITTAESELQIAERFPHQETQQTRMPFSGIFLSCIHQIQNRMIKG
jgi:hypothetical protein